MWRFTSNLTCRLLFLPKYNAIKPPRQFFFSDSFKLESEWNDRLKSPILSKINTNDMFYELDNQFQHFGYASALDLDLYVNAVNDDSSFDEVEDVVHKLRLSTEASNILPSTHHGLIRLYVKCNKTADLIRILDDRLNYGIFSDDYCTLLMMDAFIKAGNFRDAAKVSTFNMLQEDVSNPLIMYMSLYACHKYLENPTPWKDEDEKNDGGGEDDDDDEEVKVRVKYIRNPYFDDHFDLVDPKHLLGKTLNFIGTNIVDHVGRSYKLLGLLLHDKFEQANDYIKTISESKETPTLAKDALSMANNILDERCKVDSNFKNVCDSLKELLNRSFSDAQLVIEDQLLSTVETRLRDLVKTNESSEINKQLQIYEKWEIHRGKLLQEQIVRLNKEKQLAEIERQKQLLREKEEELFFFDNEDKLDLIIEEKEKKQEEQRERERQRMLAKTNAKEEEKEPKEPTLESFFDENIPMKLIKTKL
uniref:28S ribosomal protein S27, mitochondrial n=2 Tax=Homalodisca liturata TaxID=320908 RepID=A0A1B6I1S5_9HEMI